MAAQILLLYYLYLCPLFIPYKITIMLKTGDNYVDNVYKGHYKFLSFRCLFVKISLFNNIF